MFFAAFVFVVTFAMLVRTLAIGTNDLFHFGAKDKWWCYAIVNFKHVGASIETYPAGTSAIHSGPAQRATTDWFFNHVEALGGTWALSNGAPDTYAHDYWIFGFHSYYDAGVFKGRTYWVDLGSFPAWMFLISGLFCGWWFKCLLEFRSGEKGSRCLNCSYDLRAHSSGDKCPECGELIVDDALDDAGGVAPAEDLE